MGWGSERSPLVGENKNSCVLITRHHLAICLRHFSGNRIHFPQEVSQRAERKEKKKSLFLWMWPTCLHPPLPKHKQLLCIKPRQGAAFSGTSSAICILLSRLCVCRSAWELACWHRHSSFLNMVLVHFKNRHWFSWKSKPLDFKYLMALLNFIQMDWWVEKPNVAHWILFL